MALPNIKLDERTFQDLVDEAKLRIPRYCPEWTNHNVSDPGVTLIELFAYMVDSLLYQINRVPEKNYRTFLDTIGVKLNPPEAARAEITFRLSAPQPNLIVIPKGTEVATVRTENDPARTFTTERDLNIVLPALKYVLTTASSQSFTNVSKQALDRFAPAVQVFQTQPQPGNAFYLGFDNNIAGNILVVGLDCEQVGTGTMPENAPLIWEYWDSQQSAWLNLKSEIVRDTSQGLTLPYSEVEIYMPPTAGQYELALNPDGDDTIVAWWLRCRYSELVKDQPGYNNSPVIKSFSAYTIGGTIGATHSQIIRKEDLGRSSGEPGQRFRLKNTPILKLNPTDFETVRVELPEGHAPEMWQQVPDFSESKPSDKHFVCDYITGEINFGPAIRSPNGEVIQCGAIPPYGSRIVMEAYRTGGGTEGNVGSQTITVLKTSIPYVDRVFNRRLAAGGTNAESLEHALMRGPRTLRARNRAVTAEDFEALTLEATGGVARVRCLTPGSIDNGNGERVEPGTVVIMVVPEVEPDLRELRAEHLDITTGQRATILNYLDSRRLLTTTIELTTPKYYWVTVQARIKTVNPFVNDYVKREAERRLYRFIRPVQGGPDPMLQSEAGWPFGRALYESEIYPILQTIEGVEFIERLELYPVIDVANGKAGAAEKRIDPGPRGLLVSYRHQIVIL